MKANIKIILPDKVVCLVLYVKFLYFKAKLRMMHYLAFQLIYGF